MLTLLIITALESISNLFSSHITGLRRFMHSASCALIRSTLCMSSGSLLIPPWDQRSSSNAIASAFWGVLSPFFCPNRSGSNSASFLALTDSPRHARLRCSESNHHRSAEPYVLGSLEDGASHQADKYALNSNTAE